MIFSSYDFIFLFLPCALLSYQISIRISHDAAIVTLGAVSLVFYAWWNPYDLSVLAPSVLFNFFVARRLLANRSRLLLVSAIAVNLLAIAYYKYADFFLGAAGYLIGFEFATVNARLPLGISFFTFTQIAFLVDAFQRRIGASPRLRDYGALRIIASTIALCESLV